MKTTLQNAEHYTWGEHCDGWHLHRSDELSMIREQMPPGTSETWHCHRNAQQIFYILEGEALFETAQGEQTLATGDSQHVPARKLHRISNRTDSNLHFLVVSAPKAHGDRIEIVEYRDEWKEAIKTLNVEWLQKYFRVEPNDEVQLSDPQAEILDKGGLIYYARHNGDIVGTASLLRISDKEYELGKMAVTASAQGLGIGQVLIDYCLYQAQQMQLEKLVLYSNTALQSAIHLYKKYGFVEIELEPGHYERANIKMERKVV